MKLQSEKRPLITDYNTGLSLTLDYPSYSLFQLLEESSRRFPHHKALSFLGKDMEYSALYELTVLFSQKLYNLGVRKGKTVAIILPNIPQTIISIYAILRLGGIAILLNPLYTEREVVFFLNDSNAQFLITLEDFLPRFPNLGGNNGLEAILTLNTQDFFTLSTKKPPSAAGLKVEKIEREDKGKDVPDDIKVERVEGEDIAFIQYTGGTTGQPKGAILSHRNILSNLIQMRNWYKPLEEGREVFLAVLPFFHIFGLQVTLNLPILLGGKIVILTSFSTSEILRTIEDKKITLFAGAPSMFASIIRHPEIMRYDISSLKICVSGASSLSQETQESFNKFFPVPLIEGYGLTEASPATHSNPLDREGKIGSIGLPMPDTAAFVVDLKDGKSILNPGEIGELVIKGPQVMKGYWQRPEETEAALKDGWLHTGDITRMDEEGFFYIVDRKKDMVIVSGYNVYPQEIDEVLSSHPRVKESCTVGIQNSLRGEIVKSFVVLKEGESATRKEILSFLRERLAQFKIPKIIEFREDLPHNFMGKILRKALREETRKEEPL